MTDQAGNITLVNHSAKEILHIEQDVIGKPVLDVLPHTELAHVLSDEQREVRANATFTSTSKYGINPSFI